MEGSNKDCQGDQWSDGASKTVRQTKKEVLGDKNE